MVRALKLTEEYLEKEGFRKNVYNEHESKEYEKYIEELKKFRQISVKVFMESSTSYTIVTKIYNLGDNHSFIKITKNINGNEANIEEKRYRNSQFEEEIGEPKKYNINLQESDCYYKGENNEEIKSFGIFSPYKLCDDGTRIINGGKLDEYIVEIMDQASVKKEDVIFFPSPMTLNPA